MDVRTKEEFDLWFLNSGGDPWGYDSPYIKERLEKSIQFILRYVNAKYRGNIIEFGAFNGDFTFLLGTHFLKAVIYANDISEVALNQAKAKCMRLSNIKYLLQDLLLIQAKQIKRRLSSVITLLECLYYLNNEERVKAIANIHKQFPKSKLFISAPMTGEHYFTEEDLLSLFESQGYRYVASEKLNSYLSQTIFLFKPRFQWSTIFKF